MCIKIYNAESWTEFDCQLYQISFSDMSALSWWQVSLCWSKLRKKGRMPASSIACVAMAEASMLWVTKPRSLSNIPSSSSLVGNVSANDILSPMPFDGANLLGRKRFFNAPKHHRAVSGNAKPSLSNDGGKIAFPSSFVVAVISCSRKRFLYRMFNLLSIDENNCASSLLGVCGVPSGDASGIWPRLASCSVVSDANYCSYWQEYWYVAMVIIYEYVALAIILSI